MQRTADEVGRRLMTRIEQEDALMQQLVFGEGLAVGLAHDEARQNVGVRVAQVRTAIIDQDFQIREHVGDCPITPGRALRREHGLQRAQNLQRPAAQRRALVVRNAEEISDNSDRNRCRKRLDQIDLPRVAHRREQAIDQRDQAGLHGGDMALAYRADDRRTRVCAGGSLKTRLLVWCSKSGVTPNFGPNSFFLSELKRLKSLYAGTMSS